MSEEECPFGPGLKTEHFGTTLKVTDLSRKLDNYTDEVTMTIDTTFLLETEIFKILEFVEKAYKDIQFVSDQKVNFILNDSSVDSTEFFKKVLKFKGPPMMKILLAISGRLAVKNLGLSSALELLDAKTRDSKGEFFNYGNKVFVDYAEWELLILPGMTAGRQIFFDREKSTSDEVESVFRVENIVQLVSFATQKSSSVTLDKYLSSSVHIEAPDYPISAVAIQALAKIAKVSPNEIGSLTSDQLREFLALIELCDLETYPIEAILDRLRLTRVVSPHHPENCHDNLVPFFTLDEIKKLDSEAKNLNLGKDAKILASHLHSPVDFLVADLAARKGLSRYVEFCGFISKIRASSNEYEKDAPLVFFNRHLDKYLMEISREILKNENDGIPIAWIAAMSEHQPSDELLSYLTSS